MASSLISFSSRRRYDYALTASYNRQNAPDICELFTKCEHLFYISFKTLTSVQVKTTTSVIQTPCAPILRGPMFVVVQGDTLVMAKTAQVDTPFFFIAE